MTVISQRITLDTFVKIIPVNRIKHYVSDVMFQLLFFTCSCKYAVTDLKVLLN